jgi:hypothetical protein
MTIYGIPFKLMDGSPARLAKHPGKVLLLVNVVSKCGLTPEDDGMEKLYENKRAALAANNSRSGASGDKPAATGSAFANREPCAIRGKYFSTKVVLPAPLGPACCCRREIAPTADA